MKEFLFVALFEKLYLKLPTTLKCVIPLILTLLYLLYLLYYFIYIAT